MKNIKLVLLFSLISLSAYSQNITDVVRWSTIDYVGTARTLGVGSSFGAMGGDFSVININPAGIADYRISEFTLTPSLRSNTSKAWFAADPNNIEIGKTSKLGLDNIGIVIASHPNGSLTSSNFAIGFSRVTDLGSNTYMSGIAPGSITTYFAEQAQGLTVDELDDFIAYPAYNVGAILEDSNNSYFTDFTNPAHNVIRDQDIFRRGGINELTLGWAGEYDNQLNMGISMGIPFSSFEELKSYRESDPFDEVEFFDDLTYTERLNISGVGFNLKAGFTYKLMNTLRIAGAFHSPTWYKFTDDYSTSMEYAFSDSRGSFRNSYDSPGGVFEYKIRTPWRAIGSVGGLLRLGDVRGFINADIEFVDYTNAFYNGTAYISNQAEISYTNQVNKEILTKLGSAVNFRIGSEFGYKSLRLRAGYGIERTAFAADDFYNKKLSLGIGFRADRFFMDLGFRFSNLDEGYYPYLVQDKDLNPLVNIDNKSVKSNLTFGFKF